MTFETVIRNASACQKRVVLADPCALRECADRLEVAANACLPGESILVELTRGISIIFKPEPSSSVYEYIEGTQNQGDIQ